MPKLRLVLLLIMAWVTWQNWILPVSANEPRTPLSTEITPQQLVIPSISLNTSIVPVGLKTVVINSQEYLIWNTAENNVGWHRGSGPPGQIGNTVLAGHSNGDSEIFRHLDKLEIGEEIFVATNMGWHHYRVAEKLILHEQGEPYEVRLANARWILPTGDERLTLVTCWPFPSDTHRLIVIAYPVSQSPILESSRSSQSPTPSPFQVSSITSKQNVDGPDSKEDLQLQRLIKRYELSGLNN